MEKFIEGLKEIPYWLIAFLIGASFHEFAHAWVADRLGDNTPRYDDRLTLNPLKHIDRLGLIVLLVSSASGFGFGWAKPVQIDREALTHPRTDMMLISFAGPLMNFLLVVVCVVISGLIFGRLDAGNPVEKVLNVFILMNLTLAVLNLMPLGMLDGAKVVAGLLNEKWAARWEKTYGCGTIVLLILLFTQWLFVLMTPLALWFALITGAIFVVDWSALGF